MQGQFSDVQLAALQVLLRYFQPGLLQQFALVGVFGERALLQYARVQVQRRTDTRAGTQDQRIVPLDC